MTGRIGQHPDSREAQRVLAGVSGLVVLGFVAAGAVMLVSGQLMGLAAVLAPLVWAAGVAGISVWNQRLLERGDPRAHPGGERDARLDRAFPGPDAVPAGGGDSSSSSA